MQRYMPITVKRTASLKAYLTRSGESLAISVACWLAFAVSCGMAASTRDGGMDRMYWLYTLPFMVLALGSLYGLFLDARQYWQSRQE